MKDKFQIQLEWTVEKTLREQPETSGVFIKHRTQCVGCLMQKFCTIKDVTEIYKMEMSEFLQDLNQSTLNRSVA
jgi:hybrid cluster-associated redox disulfide protein